MNFEQAPGICRHEWVELIAPSDRQNVSLAFNEDVHLRHIEINNCSQRGGIAVRFDDGKKRIIKATEISGLKPLNFLFEAVAEEPRERMAERSRTRVEVKSID